MDSDRNYKDENNTDDDDHEKFLHNNIKNINFKNKDNFIKNSDTNTFIQGKINETIGNTDKFENSLEENDGKTEIKSILVLIQVKNLIGISLLFNEEISSLVLNIDEFKLFISSISNNISFDEIHYRINVEYQYLTEFLESIFVKNNNYNNKTNKKLKLLKKSKFSFKFLFESIKNILMNYQSECNIPDLVLINKVNEILSNLKFENHLSLSYLISIADKIIKQENLQIEFKVIKLDKYTSISCNLQSEIGIFKEKIHPSLIKGKGNSKEGLSIFSLYLRNISTNSGRKLLKQIFSFPMKKSEDILLFQNCITNFFTVYESKGNSFIRRYKGYLRKISDLNRIVFDLNRFKLHNSLIWKNIFQTLINSFELINDYINLFSKNEKINGRLYQNNEIDNLLKKMSIDKLLKILSFLESCMSEVNGRIIIKEKINEDLDLIKSNYNKLNDILKNNFNDFMKRSNITSLSENLNIVFLPQLGYLISLEKNNNYREVIITIIAHFSNLKENIIYIIKDVKIIFLSEEYQSKTREEISLFIDSLIEDEEKRIENVVNLELVFNECLTENISNLSETEILTKITFIDYDLKFQFHTDNYVYYKTDETNKLDIKYGDLAGQITDIENSIFSQISKQILEFTDDLLSLNSFVSLVDCVISIFITSLDFNMTCPKFILHNENLVINNIEKSSNPNNSININIVGGRNILIEILSKNYVPFSCKIKNGVTNIFSDQNVGRTSFLKMIGQLVYLSQIGCYVPCDLFETTLFHHIHSHLIIDESILSSVSGFVGELNNLKIINETIKLVKQPRLVLLDDAYKRTSEINAFSLFLSNLDFYHSLALKKELFTVLSCQNISMLDLISNVFKQNKNQINILIEKFNFTVINKNLSMFHFKNDSEVDILLKSNFDCEDFFKSLAANNVNRDILFKSMEFKNNLKNKLPIIIDMSNILRIIDKININKIDIMSTKSYSRIFELLNN